jgi:hypothetical protein
MEESLGTVPPHLADDLPRFYDEVQHLQHRDIATEKGQSGPRRPIQRTQSGSNTTSESEYHTLRGSVPGLDAAMRKGNPRERAHGKRGGVRKRLQ